MGFRIVEAFQKHSVKDMVSSQVFIEKTEKEESNIYKKTRKCYNLDKLMVEKKAIIAYN